MATQSLLYATGRVPNYREKKVIAEVVREHHAKDGGNGKAKGFQDLIIALIQSEVFRSK